MVDEVRGSRTKYSILCEFLNCALSTEIFKKLSTDDSNHLEHLIASQNNVEQSGEITKID